MMTKVGQLFEEEKIQYGEEIRRQVTRDVKMYQKTKNWNLPKKCFMQAYL